MNHNNLTPQTSSSQDSTTLRNLEDLVHDPQVRMSLELCQDQISEPFLSLPQLLVALKFVRPGGRLSARTVQRWVKEKGFPCFFDEASERRVYRLSSCLDWFRDRCPAISLAQGAAEAAKQMMLTPGGRQGHLFGLSMRG